MEAQPIYKNIIGKCSRRLMLKCSRIIITEKIFKVEWAKKERKSNNVQTLKLKRRGI
jgi:hypothetical protein